MAATTIDDGVKQRAFDLFLQRNGMHGSDQDDWYQAEQELKDKGNGKSKAAKRANGRAG